jgi:hypothetical protein
LSILVHSVASGWWEKNNPKPSPWISCTKPLHWWDLWQLPPYINEQMIVPKKKFNICKPKIILVTNDWSINRITTYIELPHSTHIYSKFRTPATNSKPCRYPAPTWELACCSLSEGRDVDFRTVDGPRRNAMSPKWDRIGMGARRSWEPVVAVQYPWPWHPNFNLESKTGKILRHVQSIPNLTPQQPTVDRHHHLHRCYHDFPGRLDRKFSVEL